MTRFRMLAAVVSLGIITALMAPAGAAPGLTVSGITKVGNIATVNGSAVFESLPEPASVGGFDTEFAQVDVAGGAGINLVDAKIQPIDGGLRFIWQLSDLPDQVPPEGVRYTWAFAIGQNAYQLQAKRTNVASVTTLEDPVNHITHVGNDFFQLRGACSASYAGTPTSGCYHLAWLAGSFDTTNNQVTVDLPYQTKDQIGRLVAPDFKSGVVLSENLQATMSITAAFQAVVGNTYTSDYINGWEQYFVGGVVQLAAAPAGRNPVTQNYTSSATLTGSDFVGSIPLTTVNNTVYIRACSVKTCTYATATP